MKLLTIIIVLNALVINTVLSAATCPTVKGGNLVSVMNMPNELNTFYKNKCNELKPPTQAHVDAALQCLKQYITPCAEKHAKKLADAALSCLKSQAFSPSKICAPQTMSAIASCFENNVMPKTSMDQLMTLATKNVGLIAQQVKQFKSCCGKIKK